MGCKSCQSRMAIDCCRRQRQTEPCVQLPDPGDRAYGINADINKRVGIVEVLVRYLQFVRETLSQYIQERRSGCLIVHLRRGLAMPFASAKIAVDIGANLTAAHKSAAMHRQFLGENSRQAIL